MFTATRKRIARLLLVATVSLMVASPWFVTAALAGGTSAGAGAVCAG